MEKERSVMHVFITRLISFIVIALVSWSLQAQTSDRQSRVIPASALKWGYLNPLRGDKSPAAADLWGDRAQEVATGMLVKFNQGFSSPPHSHNISYRGVVIEGLMHNDDPTAEHMWLPAASYWTQPAGENHITAARGESNMIYLEIDSGPYLVNSADKPFDNGERPVNVHTSNLVWLGQDKLSGITGKNIHIAQLWQDETSGAMAGSLLKLPVDFKGKLTSTASEFRVVIIKGSVVYASQETTAKHLSAGSYFSSTGDFTHHLSTSDETIVYIRANAQFHVVAASE
jgi:hypothetical protein